MAGISPIAGAGSADTYPLHEPSDLDEVLARVMPASATAEQTVTEA